MIRTLIFAALVLLLNIEFMAQDRWSVTYSSDDCSDGFAQGFGVEVWNDTIYVSGAYLDENCLLGSLLLKYDLNGNLLATRVIEDSLQNGFRSFSGAGMDMMEWNSPDDFILPYTQFTEDFDSTRMYIRKFDTNLQDVWIREIQRPTPEDNTFANVVRTDNEGNIFVSCVGFNPDFVESTDSPYTFMQKLDPQGNLIWESIYDEIWGSSEITLLSDGDMILNGQIWYSMVNQILIQKLDSIGQEKWRYTTGGLNSIGSTCVEDDQGRIIISNTWNNDNPPNQYWDTPYYQFRKLEDTGWYFQQVDEVKYGRFGGRKYDNITKILNDGNIVTAGMHDVNTPITDSIPYSRAFMFKVDENLDSLWFRTYWHPEEIHHFASAEIWDFDTLSDGGFICTGTVIVPNMIAEFDLWLMRLDEFGCLEPGCHNVNVSEIVIGFENSMKVFPNPVRDHATIQFEIPNPAILQNNFSKTQLIVTDISGREIERMNLPSFGARYQLELNTAHYAQGLYQVHWVSGGTWLDTVELVKE